MKSKSRNNSFFFFPHYFSPSFSFIYFSPGWWASVLLFTHSVHVSLQDLSSSRFTSSVPCVFCWLDHPLISHSPTSARAHDLTIANNKQFVIALPRLSTSDSSVNYIIFQNNRAGSTKHRTTSESFRATLLALWPQTWNKHSSISHQQKGT